MEAKLSEYSKRIDKLTMVQKIIETRINNSMQQYALTDKSPAYKGRKIVEDSPATIGDSAWRNNDNFTSPGNQYPVNEFSPDSTGNKFITGSL